MALNIPNPIPGMFLVASDEQLSTTAGEFGGKRNIWDRFSRFSNWLKKEEGDAQGSTLSQSKSWDSGQQQQDNGQEDGQGFSHRRPTRKAVPGLPRPITFRRQNSEKRERLEPHRPPTAERRALSADRRHVRRTLSPSPLSLPSLSAPNIRDNPNEAAPAKPEAPARVASTNNKDQHEFEDEAMENRPLSQQLPLLSFDEPSDNEDSEQEIDPRILQEELESKWILNLSMHFRDMSDREKFFITFAEKPNFWRRVTVSCDYRDCCPDSLEQDLKSLHYQRDKNARIYEAIRDSLPAIQFYDTVTNLKLQTAEGRLHVHVTEDVNEIIQYPSVSAIGHLQCREFTESSLDFESHISGFVYKVNHRGRSFIKKEIPGPDTVEEFLYEINALSSLQDSQSVIQFEGIVVDEKRELLKGLLISFAEQGALVDLIYDWKGTSTLPWKRRERWAKQIVQGLSEIHEAGFVQGDFTLSNIVVDSNDNAKIIDINRRGCPVGWEPPEMSRLIESKQRISIYIGVKSDLFQLGMVLWALAEEEDEPERQERPLTFSREGHEVPTYFREIISSCLDDDPRRRLSARDHLAKFPEIKPEDPKPLGESRHSVSTHRSDKEYIDPATAVGLEDIDQYKRKRASASHSDISAADITFTEAVPSTGYPYNNSSGSYIVARSGRSPTPGLTRNYEDFLDVSRLSMISYNDSDAGQDLEALNRDRDRESQWEQIYMDRDAGVVDQASIEPIEHSIVTELLHEELALEPELKKETRNDSSDKVRFSDVKESPSPQHTPSPFRSHRASFHERALALREFNNSHLADLEDEISGALSPIEPPAAIFTHFGPPTHKDSGFDESPQTASARSQPETPLRSETVGKPQSSTYANVIPRADEPPVIPRPVNDLACMSQTSVVGRTSTAGIPDGGNSNGNVTWSQEGNPLGRTYAY